MFFILWVLFFATQYRILQAGFDDADYPDLNSFIQLIVISMRISIGDI